MSTVRSEIAMESLIKPSQVAVDSVEAMSIKYNTMVYELQRRNVDVIVMSLGEAFFDIPLFSFDNLPLPEIYHYSHSRGIPRLRERLSDYFLKSYDVSFDPETEIIITAGSKVAIHMALMSVIDPGDEVIIHEPAWVSFPEQVKLCYGVPVHVPYYEQVFDFPKYVTNKTKGIIINNPQNPSGKVFGLDELSYLYELAERRNLFVLSDEVYSDFLLAEDKFVSLAAIDTDKTRVMIFNSISKNFGISGWRLGYVIANRGLINQILKVNQHLITCPATILEHYIAEHFDEILEITKPQIQQVLKKRQLLAKHMDQLGMKYLPGTATFYFFVSIENSSLASEDFCSELLQNRHVSTVPGLGYGKSCDRFIRVSVGTESMERTKYGLDSIKALIDAT